MKLHLTGESIPVDKTVRRSAYRQLRSTSRDLSDVKHPVLAKILHFPRSSSMVSDAAATKAPIAKVADKVSGVFVPTVISIAVVTLVVWLLAGRECRFCT